MSDEQEDSSDYCTFGSPQNESYDEDDFEKSKYVEKSFLPVNSPRGFKKRRVYPPCDSPPSRIVMTNFSSTTFNLAEETLGSPTAGPTVTFDASSLEGSPMRKSGQVLAKPTENTPRSPHPEAIHNTALDKELAATSSHSVPHRGIRGILKSCKPLCPIENTVGECLSLLCATDDKYQFRALIHDHAAKVFKGLCADQFFQKGECFSSSCDDHHHFKGLNLSQSLNELWYASLYVICYAAKPNLQIIENLFQHYAAKGELMRALLLTKCIAKMRETDRLELAYFFVNKLSGTMPIRDVITVILMLNFSELPCNRFNALMEGLRVFEQKTTDYKELITFLNFRQHPMPSRFIVKLMEDAMKSTGSDTQAESIAGFVRRLPPSQKNDVQPIATNFTELFGIPSCNVDSEPLGKRSKNGMQVSFVEEPFVREFSIIDTPNEVYTEVVFSDEECQDDDKCYQTSSSDCAVGLLSDRIASVLGESCSVWILNGNCHDPVCNNIHDFKKNSLADLPSDDVCAAADFIMSQSVSPPIEVLKIFIESLAESNQIAKVLKFRNCTPKLSHQESVELTVFVISSLEKHMRRWDALERVLVPNITANLKGDHQFSFDAKLLCSVMSEAIETKTAILRCVTMAIVKLATAVSPFNREMTRILSSYVSKFVIDRKLPASPDVLWIDVAPDSFARELKVALYQGVSSNYFLATVMMKDATDSDFQDVALDILYDFLLSTYDRAKVLSDLLKNCNYFGANDKISLKELIGTVGLNTLIHFYEKEHSTAAAELFVILEKFKLNIFSLMAPQGPRAMFNLAIIYCQVTICTVDKKDTIDVFFSRLLDPHLASTSDLCPPELVAVTEKMFQVFTDALMVEESLKLYNGIITRQKSLVTPLNIVQFVEPTLSCTFHRSQDGNIRRETIKLYVDAIDSGAPVTFQKVTHRSVFLVALKEITVVSLKSGVMGNRNVLHPLIKKMLIRCIKAGAYHDIKSLDINLYSSMTEDELRVYLVWWFALYNRGRKRGGIDYFCLVKVKIHGDLIQNDACLPTYHSLQSVYVSVMDCAMRVRSVIQNMIGDTLMIIPTADRGVFDLHPFTVRAVSQVAINTMVQHGYVKSDKSSLCTRCFDSMNVDLNGNI